MIALPDEAHESLAVGWATIDLDRAALELAHLLRPGGAFTPAPASVALGARCRVGPAARAATLRIVLLEPDTEGRLAATLARHGEGWAARWQADPGIGNTAPSATVATSAARPGPLGPERLVLRDRLAAPLHLLVDVPSPP